MLTEAFNLVGVVLITAVAVNYARLVASFVIPWIVWPNVTVTTFIVFWALLLVLGLLMRAGLRAINKIVKWERVHWFLQGLGVAVGLVRGFWWASLVLLTLVASGVPYLESSAQERSMLGPQLLTPAYESYRWVTDRFPGAQYRWRTLAPPLVPSKKKS